MHILFVSSGNMMAANLALLMKREGHEVKLCIDDHARSENFEGIVEKTGKWSRELNWVGKHGLIVFDDIGYGKIQDKLRKKGFSVFGGSERGDRLETDRQWAQEIFALYGMKTPETHDFKNAESAILFFQKNPNAWVVKQNGWGAKNLNYVPHFPDGKDSLAVLRTYASNPILRKEKITLQKKIVGIEIGVARYFNGKDWVGPIEVNIEHKKMFTGDLGPSTSEMGTLAWYDNSENRLFNETLGKLKPYLQEIDFRGDIDINCIVNDEGAYTLEATPRLGSPAIYIHAEIHESPWAEFLKAVADGKEYDLQWKSGFGIAVLLAVPPFPFSKEINEISPKNLPVYLEEAERVDKGKHLHFEGVSRDEKKPAGEYYVSDGQGYVAYITSLAPTVEEARQKAQRLVESVYIPKMFYRNDIGVAFVEKSAGALKSLKYL